MPRPRLRPVDRRLLGFILALVAVGTAAYLFGGLAWLELTAVAGTALGTLGLAFYTQDLARQTSLTVEESRALHAIAQRQLAAAQEQAEAAREDVAASQRAGREAARARVDASAPVVDLRVTAAGVRFVREGIPPQTAEWLGEQALGEGQVLAHTFFVNLALRFTNFGQAPARVEFPSLWPDLERVEEATRRSRILSLSPGESYEDTLPVRLEGYEATGVKEASLAVRYAGPLAGTAVDELGWEGTVQPLEFWGGVYHKHRRSPLTASRVAVSRTYVLEVEEIEQ